MLKQFILCKEVRTLLNVFLFYKTPSYFIDNQMSKISYCFVCVGVCVYVCVCVVDFF